jgi:hypothetical protein
MRQCRLFRPITPAATEILGPEVDRLAALHMGFFLVRPFIAIFADDMEISTRRYALARQVRLVENSYE